MIVKAVDIARELGISKATVSLALNDKPGVNPKTKEMILECKERMERSEGTFSPGSIVSGDADTIKLVLMNCSYRIAINAELDLWTDEKAVFTRIAKKWGCKLDIVYFDVDSESADSIADLCNKDDVLGVVIEGTEMSTEESKLLEKIKKPLVLYDVDLDTKKYSSVMMDNKSGVYDAMNALTKKGYRDIVYLAMDYTIYNFSSRRNAFIEYMREHNLDPNASERIIRVGTSINDSYKKIEAYLDKNPLPEAFLTESYHLSISLIRLFRERGIVMPKDVALVGIDELPEYMTNGYLLSTVKIPSTERAKLTMEMLKHEIEDGCDMKTKLYTSCRFIEGNTI